MNRHDASTTAPPAGPEHTEQLPSHQISTAEGPMTVRRAWPHPGAARPILAVELQDGETVRSGWWVSGELRLTPRGDDPKLPELASAAQSGVVVSHRPSKRAVVRSADGRRFVKLVKRGKAAAIKDGMARAASFSGPYRTPAVLSSTPSSVTFSALEGHSMHEAHLFSDAQWRAAWTQICAAWVTALRRPPAAGGASAEAHSLIHRAAAEIGVLRHWHQSTLPWLEDAEQTAHSLERLAGILAGLPEEQLRPAHRDLHDKQLVWSADTGPGLLDADTACLADPALDLGNLRAHAYLRRLQGVWSDSAAETVTCCVDEAARSIGAETSTVAVYEQSALLRLGMVYAVRPQYAGLAAQLRQLVRAQRH